MPLPAQRFLERRAYRAIALLGALIATLPGWPVPGRADSAWQQDIYSALRLVDGEHTMAGEYAGAVLAAIEIRMQTGWKTYWRYPGDSGIPPLFDFAGSDNVKSALVLWPAAQAFADGAGGQSIGYHDHVILPIAIYPNDPAKPVRLRLAAQYAVCEKLCVPAQAKAELAMSARSGAVPAEVAAALAQVPRKVTPGAKGVAIRAITREETKKRIVIAIARGSGEARANLFAEGPTPEWALPLAKPIASSRPDVALYALALDGAPPGARYDNLHLRVTLSAGTASEEANILLK